MPRKSRIDAAGAIHHVIVRGINRADIFSDDSDYKSFLNRLDSVLTRTKTACYAWALMSNHFHLLLRTGNTPISTVMRRLLTGYAVNFNRKHKRFGHLFQNRYKSILCQEDLYLRELVRYIHLNPLRAGMVPDYRSLGRYYYCGHGVILGHFKNDWQDTEYVLDLFGNDTRSGRRGYSEFVRKASDQGRRPGSALLLGWRISEYEAAGVSRVTEYNSIGCEYGSRARPYTCGYAAVDGGYGIVSADHRKFIPKRNIFLRTAIIYHPSFFLNRITAARKRHIPKVTMAAVSGIRSFMEVPFR
jgi:REP element-mobilizing transposase RayT